MHIAGIPPKDKTNPVTAKFFEHHTRSYSKKLDSAAHTTILRDHDRGREELGPCQQFSG